MEMSLYANMEDIMPPIPADISTALVVFASFMSHLFRSDKLPRGLNILFAALAFILSSAVTFWLLGGIAQGATPRETLTAFILFTGSLAGKELLALLSYLQETASPLDAHFIDERSTRPVPVVRRASRDEQV
jgi:branched-subunit amino acid transport protein